MCDCDLYAPEFFNVETPVARKPHRCCECRGEISKGERYVRSSGKWEGALETFVQCQSCVDLGKEFSTYLNRVDGCCLLFTELWDAIYQELRDGLEQDADSPLSPSKELAASLTEKYRDLNRLADEARKAKLAKVPQ